MLQVLEYSCVQPHASDHPDCPSLQSIACHSNRTRPEIGCKMLELTRKAASHHVLRRQQRQYCQDDDTNPRQETKGDSKGTKGHTDTLSDLVRFSKRNPA